jgi:hypothetical protein
LLFNPKYVIFKKVIKVTKEYDAPEDFECIWQKELVSSLTKDTGSKKGTDCLWIKT